MAPSRDADVPAIGGGPAGSAATTFLARGGVRVAVVERQAFPRFKVRASLAPTSIALCERIGVLSALCTGGFRAAPFRSYEHAMRRGARRFEQFIELFHDRALFQVFLRLRNATMPRPLGLSLWAFFQLVRLTRWRHRRRGASLESPLDC